MSNANHPTDDVLRELTDAAQRSRDEPTVSEMHAELQALRDEVDRLRSHLAEHDHLLVAVGGDAPTTPDQRAIAARLELYHRARASDEGEAAVDWKGVNEIFGGDLFKQQCYEIMHRAARGTTYTQGAKCELEVVPGFELRNSNGTGKAREPMHIVCTAAHVPKRETVARLSQ